MSKFPSIDCDESRPANWHYYEAHINLEPWASEMRRHEAYCIGLPLTFRVANLMMAKGLTADAFLTARAPTLLEITHNTRQCVRALRAAGFKVTRYKIEYTMIDSRNGGDELELLQ